jgi:hypothetical protein
MSNEKTVYTLHPFVEWAHKTGRIFMICFIAYSIAIPVVISAAFNAWPSLPDILPALLTLLAMLGVQGVLEAALYTPILGSSCYLTFATGNIMNLKVPCALNAQKVAGVETNTTAGDAIALISTCVSSIVTTIILFLGMFLVIPLKPFLESQIASSASNYLMAALFGCLVLAFIAPSGGKTDIKNKLWIGIIPFVLTAALAIAGVLETSAAVAMVLVAITVCLITARILYKKGIVRVVTKE